MRWTLAELFRRDEPPAPQPVEPLRRCVDDWCVPNPTNPPRCIKCGTPLPKEGNQ